MMMIPMTPMIPMIQMIQMIQCKQNKNKNQREKERIIGIKLVLFVLNVCFCLLFLKIRFLFDEIK